MQKRCDILHYRKLYLIRFGGFGKPLDSVYAFEPLDYCFFIIFDGRKRKTALNSKAVSRLTGERSIARNEHLHGSAFVLSKSSSKVSALKRPSSSSTRSPMRRFILALLSPLCTAREVNSAVFVLHILHFHPPQLVGNGTLKAEQARHCKSLKLSIIRFSVNSQNFVAFHHTS